MDIGEEVYWWGRWRKLNWFTDSQLEHFKMFLSFWSMALLFILSNINPVYLLENDNLERFLAFLPPKGRSRVLLDKQHNMSTATGCAAKICWLNEYKCILILKKQNGDAHSEPIKGKDNKFYFFQYSLFCLENLLLSYQHKNS